MEAANTQAPAAQAKPKKVNLRTPDVMDAVKEQVEGHYRSETVERLRNSSTALKAGGLKIKLAKKFGFCYGVERAIDLAYAARKVFKEQPLYILGEIIHNPEVNEQLAAMDIRPLSGKNKKADIEELKEGDVVIIPAFGAEVAIMDKLRAKGCLFVDTTCGDVMSVWRRVKQNATEGITSIIHGKAWHEETLATSSRATENGHHYLVVYNLAETDYVCDYIRKGGSKDEFLKKFEGAYSQGFDPDIHLAAVGVANQTTMMRGETEEVQRRIRQAIIDRYGAPEETKHFRFFDTICGATQERQDALEQMLKEKMDLLLVIGGYNSSNTSHLAEMGEALLPTYFIRNASRIVSDEKIIHFDLHKQDEVEALNWLPKGDVVVGITSGASCPNNLIEDVIKRILELRGAKVEDLIPA
ncbi:4-hydroxy-3-methylbut-2-enyl diphosphate reductase [Oscillatoria laete-virens NRMC-F 0139]|nr:4-hydroxy-3-methylbut-2-enyl diphosphate reductase [Oscillatoria laete-virens]MDL5054014.1 4-hydroxy-3-methylbut-2-enyl diphosphate reductase [Oscillatoria laete-virens NRMC-F 0139]